MFSQVWMQSIEGGAVASLLENNGHRAVWGSETVHKLCPRPKGAWLCGRLSLLMALRESRARENWGFSAYHMGRWVSWRSWSQEHRRVRLQSGGWEWSMLDCICQLSDFELCYLHHLVSKSNSCLGQEPAHLSFSLLPHLMKQSTGIQKSTQWKM